MNKKRRDQVNEALLLFRRGASIIERVRDCEQDSVDNYPENLQSTVRFEKMESSLEHLERSADIITDIESTTETLLEKLEELEKNLISARA